MEKDDKYFIKALPVANFHKPMRLNQLTTQFPWSIIFFFVLIISLHFLYQWWEQVQFWPFVYIMNHLFAWGTIILVNQSELLMNLVGINFYKESYTFFIEANNGTTGWLRIDPACTSVKAWFYWFFIILVVSGPWKSKAWYFPLGIILIHFVNTIRIVALAFVLTYAPGKFNFYHDMLGILVYGTIFLLWVLWIEKISKLKPKGYTI